MIAPFVRAVGFRSVYEHVHDVCGLQTLGACDNRTAEWVADYWHEDYRSLDYQNGQVGMNCHAFLSQVYGTATLIGLPLFGSFQNPKTLKPYNPKTPKPKAQTAP